METKLAENIKIFRKESKMTQEQLTEVMAMMVDAVYKWGPKQSTPEIGIIVEMEDLFRTSTDVLLVHERRSGNTGTGLERNVYLTNVLFSEPGMSLVHQTEWKHICGTVAYVAYAQFRS